MKVLQILVLMLGFVVFANGQKAILSGNVTDKWGAVIPNVKIEARNSAGKTTATRTNDDGHYQLNLIEGEYTIEITKTPFDKISVSNYWINYKMQFDVALQCKDCELIDHDQLESEPLQEIAPENRKITDRITQRPLETLPKKQNKTKRKNKNNNE